MATFVWPPKDPDETVKRTADWTDELGSDCIASWTMIVESGDATIDDGEQANNKLAFMVTAGSDDTTTVFLLTVTTDAGQVLERHYSLYVADDLSGHNTTSTTKRQLVEQMFTECALAGWEYDITPEEKDRALIRLDALMWELKGRGLDLNYNFPTGIGAGNLDDDLGCADQAFFGLAILGAERLCPTMGKTQSKESRIALSEAMKAVRSAAQGYIPTSQLRRGTPIGAGNRWSYRRFVTVQ